MQLVVAKVRNFARCVSSDMLLQLCYYYMKYEVVYPADTIPLEARSGLETTTRDCHY